MKHPVDVFRVAEQCGIRILKPALHGANRAVSAVVLSNLVDIRAELFDDVDLGAMRA